MPRSQEDDVDVGRRAVASVPFDARTDDHGGAVIVLPDEIGGGFPLLGLARFDPLQIADSRKVGESRGKVGDRLRVSRPLVGPPRSRGLISNRSG